MGALIGAIAVALLFFAVAPAFRSVDNIGTILYGSSAIGIMAVGVALLMIGGEFDLSAGVAVTTSGLVAAETAWYFGLNVWVGIFAALVVSLAIGLFNGWLLHITGLPSFLVTLGTFFVLQGVNLAMTRMIAGGVSSSTITDIDGFESAQEGLRLVVRHRRDHDQDPGRLLDRPHDPRLAAPAEDEVRQLDLRGRR